MKNFVSIRPITSQAELDEVVKAAAADKHTAIRPTHVFRKNGEVVGYASICQLVPLVPNPIVQSVQWHVWFHTQKLGPRDSFTIINDLENFMACSTTASTALVPCDRNSPFDALMTAMGYSPIIDTRLWAKTLR